MSTAWLRYLDQKNEQVPTIAEPLTLQNKAAKLIAGGKWRESATL